MDCGNNNAPLSSLMVGQLIEIIRGIVREELHRNAGQVSGLTYKPLYKIDELCQVFKVTPPTIYDWIKRGKLKLKKIRSRVFFLWEDIQELLASKQLNGI